MDFYEVVKQAAALIQQQGKLTYRTLRRQFALDDETLEDLKEELLFSHPVVDEDGRGLVWTGETEATPVTTRQPDQPEPQPVVEQAPPIQETTSPVEPHPPDAERRQLTVMFVDLVDSTRLSSELDPEIYREIVREYQRSCSEVVAKYAGNVAQLLGDGLLVYFGYPVAHEDDAQRAVRSGLGIIEAIGSLNTRLEQDKGVKLAVRLGIHTGLVVVGEMGGSGRQEQLALGETPNVAARIQGIAQPDTMVISDATYRLIQGYFDCDVLGEHDLRGLSQPIAVYRVLGDTGIQSRLDVASTRGLTPLVGRESETTLLFERWQQAKDGNGQAVLLSGEAGIGKSRLVQVLKDHVADESHTRTECRSSPYFSNSALYPITDFLQRMLRFQAEDTPEQKLEKLEHNLRQFRLPLAETVPLFGNLLSLPVSEDRYPPLNLSPQRQRQKTLEALVAIILELAEREPVLFILEDLHWVDKSMHLLRLVSVYQKFGQIEEGLALLDEATSHIEQTDERFCETEFHRFKGELLLQKFPNNQAEPETCFNQAISIAQSQSAKSWELRAATSLARLWQSQGKRDEARELLEPVYSWFTEGFDTVDLIDAKKLLNELSSTV